MSDASAAYNEYASRFGAIQKNAGLDFYLAWFAEKPINQLRQVFAQLYPCRTRPMLPDLKEAYFNLFIRPNQPKKTVPQCRHCRNTGQAWVVLDDNAAHEVFCRCPTGAKRMGTGNMVVRLVAVGSESAEGTKINDTLDWYREVWESELYATKQEAQRSI